MFADGISKWLYTVFGAMPMDLRKISVYSSALKANPVFAHAMGESKVQSVSERVNSVPWTDIGDSLHRSGNALITQLLSKQQCDELVSLYQQAELYRKRIVMEKHGFGRGEYQYFKYPLPALVAGLRTSLYPFLAPVANRWYEAMKLEVRFPASHAEFLQRCHQAGQLRPTPLLLKYVKDDYNCLHQDLYGEHLFPLQVAVLLSLPGRDFTGGEFVLTEQRPRMQSRAEVVPLSQGDAVVFAVNQRPAQGTRGFYRVNHRHGVSTLRSGNRFTLGINFHDAQ